MHLQASESMQVCTSTSVNIQAQSVNICNHTSIYIVHLQKSVNTQVKTSAYI